MQRRRGVTMKNAQGGSAATSAKGGTCFRMAAACLLAGLLVILSGSSAFAADEDNMVNPQQRPDSSFIYDTSIASLDEADSYYNNQTVQVVGEVIGDNIRQGLSNKHSWVTLTSLEKEVAATLSVYLRTEAAEKIDAYGKYGVTGTTLQVRGTFHLVCQEHEGLTDLHADIVTVVEKGKHHQDDLDPSSFIPGAILVVIGLVLMGLYYYLRERQR